MYLAKDEGKMPVNVLRLKQSFNKFWKFDTSPPVVHKRISYYVKTV